MKSTIIAQSNSGATVVYLNPDGTIGFNSKAPIMSLGNLKWLRMQPWFKQGFLNRISDEVLMDVEPVELDIKNFPLLKDISWLKTILMLYASEHIIIGSSVTFQIPTILHLSEIIG